MRSLCRTLSRGFSRRNKQRKKRLARQGVERPNEFVRGLELKKEVVRAMFFGDVRKDEEETEHLYDAIQRFKQVGTKRQRRLEAGDQETEALPEDNKFDALLQEAARLRRFRDSLEGRLEEPWAAPKAALLAEELSAAVERSPNAAEVVELLSLSPGALSLDTLAKALRKVAALQADLEGVRAAQLAEFKEVREVGLISGFSGNAGKRSPSPSSSSRARTSRGCRSSRRRWARRWICWSGTTGPARHARGSRCSTRS